jgi:hypothetical protein
MPGSLASIHQGICDEHLLAAHRFFKGSTTLRCFALALCSCIPALAPRFTRLLAIKLDDQLFVDRRIDIFTLR